MWCAHWGEDEHVEALLNAKADSTLVTAKVRQLFPVLLTRSCIDAPGSAQPWFNGAVEYEAGMTALEVARRDLEEFDGDGACTYQILCSCLWPVCS
eukprot:SAG11_NODE_6836_length_1238_cov_1.065847_2_plen_96_part_00